MRVSMLNRLLTLHRCSTSFYFVTLRSDGIIQTLSHRGLGANQALWCRKLQNQSPEKTIGYSGSSKFTRY